MAMQTKYFHEQELEVKNFTFKIVIGRMQYTSEAKGTRKSDAKHVWVTYQNIHVSRI